MRSAVEERDTVNETRGDSSWWLGLVAALVSFVLGIVLVFWPRKSVIVLAWLGGIALVVWGVRMAAAALRSADQFDRSGGVFVALVTIGFGVAVVVIPDVSLRLLRILLGIAVIVWGLQDAGRPFLPGRSRWWGFVVRGLGSLAVGLALIFWPEASVSLIGILLGILLMLWGMIEAVFAFALRPTAAR
jgi:uncharacterized membrane protein HdeD (DUF308 family)